jgi:cardiolipin synthase
LRAAGGEVIFYNFWIRRLHRKILIIDEQVAFLGGVNIGQAYVKWLDLHVRIEGPMARSLVRSFSHTYIMCGGKDPRVMNLEDLRTVGKVEHWFLERFPLSGKDSISRYYREHILRAKRSIIFVSPYFIPHNWLIKALSDALERGVRVEVIMPFATDPGWVNFANYSYARKLNEKGVKYYFTDEVIHAKVLLIDDEEGLVGSQNIDAQSFDFNIEAGIAFRQDDMVKDLKKIVDEWREKAHYKPEILKRKWYQTPMDVLARILQPLV